MKGFHGCYLRYDLGRGRGERIPIEESILEKILGGVGLGAWLLYKEAPVGVDAFAPEAPLIFSFSPLVGTPLTTSAKFAVVAKSPLTGMISDALSSSHFAIAVSGQIETPIADPDRVATLSRALRKRAAGESTAKYRELGTLGNLLSFDRLGVLPTRNFQESHFDQAEALAAETWQETRPSKRASCASCTIGCEHRFQFGTTETRVEYENVFALGPLCGVADPDVVLAASHRCDELGIDKISAGGTLAFAMECGERGLLEGGPHFGEPESMLGWLDDIAFRRDLGDALAEGSRRLAETIGQDSIDFAPQVKGLELPGYEPRAVQTLALGLAVGTRGADHNRSGAYEIDFSEDADRLHGDEHSAASAIETEDRAALIDSLILCKFVRGALEHFYSDCGEILTAVTGRQFGESELQTIAGRIVDLRKAFNIREGWRPGDDTLPKRFLTEALPSGPVRGARLPRARLEAMIHAYNMARGWEADGRIPSATLEALHDDLNLTGTDSAHAMHGGQA